MRQVFRKLTVVSGVVLGWGVAAPVHAQGTAVSNPLAQACGTDNTDLKMRRDGGDTVTTAPANKALVYVIELMPEEGGITTHVKFGVDGRWIAQLSARTFTSFVAEPGVHHLCARYEGKIAASQIDATILRRLDVEAGKTYYLLYRGFISGNAGQIGLLDLVDEDEGRYALGEADHVQATAVTR